jgi:hypothetical protein
MRYITGTPTEKQRREPLSWAAALLRRWAAAEE